jgi:signal transduction histidine kinase
VLSEREAKHREYGRLLHDQVAPTLSAAGLHLDVMRMDLSNQVPAIAERTVEIQQLLEQAMVTIRDLSREMNTSVVDRAGLRFALEKLAERSQREFDGVLRFKYDCQLRVPPEPGTAMFRVAEMALENALKHSGATKILLSVTGTRAATMQVRDNGRGFSVDSARKRGLSLTMMQAYADERGLKLTIDSQTNAGTIVRCRYAG